LKKIKKPPVRLKGLPCFEEAARKQHPGFVDGALGANGGRRFVLSPTCLRPSQGFRDRARKPIEGGARQAGRGEGWRGRLGKRGDLFPGGKDDEPSAGIGAP
jgi:hypothetical protein